MSDKIDLFLEFLWWNDLTEKYLDARHEFIDTENDSIKEYLKETEKIVCGGGEVVSPREYILILRSWGKTKEGNEFWVKVHEHWRDNVLDKEPPILLMEEQ